MEKRLFFKPDLKVRRHAIVLFYLTREGRELKSSMDVYKKKLEYDVTIIYIDVKATTALGRRAQKEVRHAFLDIIHIIYYFVCAKVECNRSSVSAFYPWPLRINSKQFPRKGHEQFYFIFNCYDK